MKSQIYILTLFLFSTNSILAQTTVVKTDRIGILADDPQHNLEVNGNASISDYLSIRYLYPNLGDGTNYRFIRFGQLNEYYGGIMWNNASSVYGNGNDFTFFTYNNRDIVLRPEGNGNVHILNSKLGIGTTSPQERLQVVDGTARAGLSLNEYTEIGHGGAHGFVNTVGDGRLDFRHDGENKMTLSATGRLGILTDNAGALLHIYTASLTENDVAFRTGGKGDFTIDDPQTIGGRFIVKHNGNIGVGTNTPQTNFHIKGNDGLLNLEGIDHAYIQFFPDGYDAGRKAWLGYENSTTNNFSITNEFSNGGMNVKTNSATRIHITNGGNVGINTTNPSTRLQVVGKFRSGESQNEYLEVGHGGANAYLDAVGDGALDFRHDGNTLMRLFPDGKLTLGDVTSTPNDYKLYVDGGILIERARVALQSSDRWADNAFGNAPSVEEMAKFIQKNSHLLGMPSADELVKNGFDLAEMDANLLRQIEWLWEDNIDLNKQVAAQDELIQKLIKRIEKLEKK